MASALVPTEKKSQQVLKLINLFAFPFLTGFLLDLPWPSQTLISIGLVLASLIAGDFVDALLNLWQAIAVAGFLFLVFSYATNRSLNPIFAALSVPIMWFGFLIHRRRCSISTRTHIRNRYSECIIGLVGLVLFYRIVPRGRIENLGLLSGEDSAGYLISIINLFRGEPFILKASFGPSDVLFFHNFFLNLFLRISELFTNSSSSSVLITLNVLSNAWIFTLLSSLLLFNRIFVLMRDKFSQINESWFLVSAASLQTFLFFRGSQSVGHFSQFLLNCAVVVFLLTLIGAAGETNLMLKISRLIISFIIAFSIVGSYAGWLPITVLCLFLVINQAVRETFLRLLFRHKFLPVITLGLILGMSVLVKHLVAASPNLEIGGGVWVIALEGVWIALLISFLLLVHIVRARFFQAEKVGSSGVSDSTIDNILTFFSVVAFVSAILLSFSHNQLTSVTFVILVGLCCNRHGVQRLFRNFVSLNQTTEFDAVFFIAFASLGYALVIYAMSRFVGPIYDPMYAANKSMFAVFGQFSWLLILLMASDQIERPNLLSRLRVIMVTIALFFVINLTPLTNYDEINQEWWHKSAVASISEYPESIVVCMPDLSYWDYEAYKCNRFMKSLTEHGFISTVFMGLALNDPNFDTAREWFNEKESINTVKYESDIKVIVITRSAIRPEWKSIFEGVSDEMIEYRVVES